MTAFSSPLWGDREGLKKETMHPSLDFFAANTLSDSSIHWLAALC